MEEQSSIKIEEEITENINSVEALKKIGLELLQNFSGEIWTDYNTHDPGITTLEILCYVITELGYRSSTSVEDIFNNQNQGSNSFYQAHQILNSGAITLTDLKKIILDISQVRNIDILKSNKFGEYSSLYTIWVELMNSNPSNSEKEKVKELITDKFKKNRLLGLDIDQVIFLDQDLVGIELDIELDKSVSKNVLLRNLIQKVDHYFSPLPLFKSIDELLDEGLSSDQIFSGPNLANGFLTDESLTNCKIKNKLYVSDLINQIMDVVEVENIKKIKLKDDKGEDYSWVYEVKENCVSRLSLKNSEINVFFQNNKLFSFKGDELSLDFLNSKTKAAHKKNTINIDKGTEINLKQYKSIQYDFPSIYGVGELGAPTSWSKEKVAYAKQFKSFLSFFDQILANYFAQLNHLPKLFSLEKIDYTNAVQWLEEMPKPYLIFKPFLEKYLLNNKDIKDENNLRKQWDIWLKANKNKQLKFLQNTIESKEVFFNRRRKVLDHLLARFGYDFSTFDSISQLDESETINHKLNILRSLPEIGMSKYCGPFSLGNSPLDLQRNSGFKLFVANCFGFRGLFNQPISESIKKISVKGESSIKLKFTNQNISESIRNLFKYGYTENFFRNHNGEIQLLDDNEKIIFSIDSGTENINISSICTALKKVDLESENCYVFDHILLRPSPELNVFGFNVNFRDENIFSSQLNLTKEYQEKEINFFIKNACDKSKYTVTEISHNQYKIQFKGDQSLLLSTMFYESKEESQSVIENSINYLKDNNEIDRVIKPTTKYNHIYNEIEDPFSNIITVVLPDWPLRFQNESFKRYISSSIIHQAPANVFVNIKWLSYEELIELENAYNNYGKFPNSENLLKEESLENLLLLLMSNGS